MLPLIAIGGAISAVASVIKGASWLSDKLGSSQATGAAGAKPAAKPQTSAAIAPFETALAAQAAGQTLPASGSGTAAGKIPTSSVTVPLIHGTDYDSLARMQAGMAAYSHIGEHRGNHPGAAKQLGMSEDKPIAQS
jgi:hypothetical protein